MLRAHAVVVALGLVASAVADGPSPLRKNLLGQTPPELIAEKGSWLGGPPVSLQKLHGRVVWLQFNF